MIIFRLVYGSEQCVVKASDLLSGSNVAVRLPASLERCQMVNFGYLDHEVSGQLLIYLLRLALHAFLALEFLPQKRVADLYACGSSTTTPTLTPTIGYFNR